MPTINISIKDKRATVEGAPVIICGNSDYSVAFTFDDEWSAHSTKTARFAYKQGGEFRYEDKIFSGTTCAVPVLIDTDLVAVGVFAGNLRTSTPSAVKCAPSVLCLGKLPADPLPSVYSQLITLINTRTPADAAWHNVTANALKGSASGEVVKLTDVSPVEHELGVRVAGRNMSEITGELSTTIPVGGYYAPRTLTNAAPFIKNGETYVLKAESDSDLQDTVISVVIHGIRANGSSFLDTKSSAGGLVCTVKPTDFIEVTGVELRLNRLSQSQADETRTIVYKNVYFGLKAYADEFIPYVDPTTITLGRYGKNLLDLDNAAKGNCKVVSYSLQADMTDRYYCELYANYLKEYLQAADGKTLTFSVSGVPSSYYANVVLMYTDGTYAENPSELGVGRTSLTLDHQGRTIQHVIIRPLSSKTAVTNTTTRLYCLQLELGDTVTEYEDYKASAAHTPDEAGAVAGVASLAPTTTLLTDTAGVVIDVTYNRDITKVINALEQALLANN